MRRFRLAALSFALSVLLLSACAPPGGSGYSVYNQQQEAAGDLQGLWVGTSDTTVVEWGFSDDDYHVVIYNSTSGAGTLETGTFSADDSVVTFSGKQAPLLGVGRTAVSTEYKLRCAADGDLLRVSDDDDDELLLHRHVHSQNCPVCRNAPSMFPGWSPSSSSSPSDSAPLPPATQPAPQPEDPVGSKPDWSGEGPPIDIVPKTPSGGKTGSFDDLGPMNFTGTATVEYYYIVSESGRRAYAEQHGIRASGQDIIIEYCRSGGYVGDTQDLFFYGLGGTGNNNYTYSMEEGVWHSIGGNIRTCIDAIDFSGTFNGLPTYTFDMDKGFVVIEFPPQVQPNGIQTIAEAALSLDLVWGEDGTLIADGWFVKYDHLSTVREYYSVHLEEAR